MSSINGIIINSTTIYNLINVKGFENMQNRNISHTYYTKVNTTNLQFETLILPILKQFGFSGTFIDIEGYKQDDNNCNDLPWLTADIAKVLDRYHGIDYIYTTKNRGFSGISSRILNDKGFRTFTIRKSRKSGEQTEYDKYKENIKNCKLVSACTVQAYVKNGKCTYVCCALTADIFDMISDNKCAINSVLVDGVTDFYSIKFKDMIKAGKKVFIWDGYKAIKYNMIKNNNTK
jgi:hypothetical protein